MITIDEIKKIAALAKLSVENEDPDRLAADFGDILKFANEVSNVELSTLNLELPDEIIPLREDAVIPSLPVEKILLNAREAHDGYFVARG